MGTGKDLVLVDTNVFVIDLRYKNDVHFNENSTFLDVISRNRTGFTTLVNLLELCGILSFNLNEKQLLELWLYFQEQYKVSVIPTATLDDTFPTFVVEELFDQIKKKASLGDALMLVMASKHMPFVKTMVTWDREHFLDKFPGTVLTPAEFLNS